MKSSLLVQTRSGPKTITLPLVKNYKEVLRLERANKYIKGIERRKYDNSRKENNSNRKDIGKVILNCENISKPI